MLLRRYKDRSVAARAPLLRKAKNNLKAAKNLWSQVVDLRGTSVFGVTFREVMSGMYMDIMRLSLCVRGKRLVAERRRRGDEKQHHAINERL